MTTLPPLSGRTALFLDFDGTLAEIVPTPELASMPDETKRALAALQQSLGGALAVVSGRRIADLDVLLSPLRFPAAGLHGLERRDAAGRLHPAPLPASINQLRARLAGFVGASPGIRLEDKGVSLALHYREAPEAGPACEAAMAEATADLPDLHLIHGKMVVEAKPRGATKGTAIRVFMTEEPFRGRTPVFAGDDVTDEDGFTAVSELGGAGIKVGPGETRANFRVPSVAALRAWLAEAAGVDAGA